MVAPPGRVARSSSEGSAWEVVGPAALEARVVLEGGLGDPHGPEPSSSAATTRA